VFLFLGGWWLVALQAQARSPLLTGDRCLFFLLFFLLAIRGSMQQEAIFQVKTIPPVGKRERKLSGRQPSS
jgi:hypothetical protein